jgi:CRP/FNR family cyclic AMP-dependent transcriptional regulator
VISTRLISSQSLRYFPHFAGLDDEYLRQIALISDKVKFEAGDVLFVEEALATHLCLLISGTVDIVYRLGDNRIVVADTLIAGDAFGWSALLEPHRLTATCVGSKNGEYLRIEGEGLRRICDEDPACGYRVVTELCKLLRDRLSALRIQIAAAQGAL